MFVPVGSDVVTTIEQDERYQCIRVPPTSAVPAGEEEAHLVAEAQHDDGGGQ
jgi:hypothetical protein